MMQCYIEEAIYKLEFEQNVKFAEFIICCNKIDNDEFYLNKLN